MTATEKKCAHEGCNCMAPAGQKYCSSVCADTKGMTTLKCGCGHSPCKSTAL